MKLSEIQNKLMNKEINKMIEYIHEYGDGFWNDYFIYLCNIYPIKVSAHHYSNVIKYFIGG